MDEYASETLANRDEPIPVVSGHGRRTSKDRFSMSSLREKFRRSSTDDGAAALSIQDQLLTKLLEQIIPVGVDDDNESVASGPKGLEQPPFSLSTMGNNFYQFNARIGIVFKFQIKVAELFSWNQPSHTWSFLAVYSFVCLNPNLIPVLPLVILLLWIMVPAFIARHPAPPPTASTSSTTPYYSYKGPALAPAPTIKPIPKTSKDFFHNLHNLQNSMADFSILHDTVVSTLSPITNFSNEILSSTAFLLLTACTTLLFLTAHLIPFHLIFLVAGNTAILCTHPSIEPLLKQAKQTHTKSFTSSSSPLTNLSTTLQSLTHITLDMNTEEHEVEIFELQHRLHSPYTLHSEWEPFVFTPTPYDPLSPSRISGDRPLGTRFLEDVQPPRGWDWKGKKWQLDLDCGEWVMERMVTGVEFEIGSVGVEGGSAEVGGWVWDLPFEEEIGLQDQRRMGKGKGKARDWEETTSRDERVGEWRRRRWVRVVKRVGVHDDE